MLDSDSKIREAVRESLLADRRLDEYDISVEVNHGQVTLKGTVDTHQASAFAQEHAAGTSAEGRVVNRIRVRFPGKIAPPTDEAIRIGIQAALTLQRNLDPADLVLAVADGVVFIDGFVETPEEKKRIERIASRERGVLEVHNNLIVASGRFRDDGAI